MAVNVKIVKIQGQTIIRMYYQLEKHKKEYLLQLLQRKGRTMKLHVHVELTGERNNNEKSHQVERAHPFRSRYSQLSISKVYERVLRLPQSQKALYQLLHMCWLRESKLERHEAAQIKEMPNAYDPFKIWSSISFFNVYMLRMEPVFEMRNSSR